MAKIKTVHGIKEHKVVSEKEWLAARKASEEKAGGSLTAKDGVKSEYMKAADFSPIR